MASAILRWLMQVMDMYWETRPTSSAISPLVGSGFSSKSRQESSWNSLQGRRWKEWLWLSVQQVLPWVSGTPGGDGFADCVGAQWDYVEEEVTLPLRRFAAQQLYVGSQHWVEKRIWAAESDLHDGGRGDVSVAILLEPRHQAGQGRPHVRGPGGADHLR